MALASPSSAETLQLKPEKSDAETPPAASTAPSSIQTSTADSPSSAAAAAAAAALIETPTPNQPNPSPILSSNPTTGLNQTPALIPPPAPAAPSFTPSFRPFGAPPAPQYTTVPNPNIQPPGVSAPLMAVNPMMPGTMYTAPPGIPPYGSNGYMNLPAPHAFPPPVDHV